MVYKREKKMDFKELGYYLFMQEQEQKNEEARRQCSNCGNRTICPDADGDDYKASDCTNWRNSSQD